MTHVNSVRDFAKVIQSLCYDEELRYRDRRSEPRHARSLSLKIQPLTHDFQVDGDSFWAISRDISSRGLAFINSCPVVHEYLRIGLLNHDVSVIGQVRHITSIGDRYPLYLVGVEFFRDEPF